MPWQPLKGFCPGSPGGLGLGLGLGLGQVFTFFRLVYTMVRVTLGLGSFPLLLLCLS